jgi:hypothetical protein
MEQQPTQIPPEAMTFKPTVPLRPPPAQNDKVMQGVQEEMEKVLKGAAIFVEA